MFGFLNGMLRAEAVRSKLHALEQVHPTAEMQGKTECCRSGICCWRRPGTVNAEDVAVISAHLGLSRQEFFWQYLKVDRIKGVLCLLPRRKDQEGGSWVTCEDSWSMDTPCVFLDTEHENACTIHDVKPVGCRNFKCWDASTVGVKQEEWSVEALRELGWDGWTDEDD